MTSIEKGTALALALVGALYAITTVIGAVLPETSRVGRIARRIALDLRGRK